MLVCAFFILLLLTHLYLVFEMHFFCTVYSWVSFFQSCYLCFVVRAFKPFIFYMNIDIIEFKSIIFLFIFLLVLSFPFFSIFLSSFGLIEFFNDSSWVFCCCCWLICYNVFCIIAVITVGFVAYILNVLVYLQINAEPQKPTSRSTK